MQCLKGRCPNASGRKYEDLRGPTEPEEFDAENGWTVDSFQTNGFE